MRSKRSVRPFSRSLVAAALLLAGCGSVFGLDDYEVTDDVRCDDQLVDLSSNPDHCGACDTACGSRAECVSGSCVCEPDAEDCSGSCVDLDTDESHCGRCDAACADDATCKAGTCVCDDADLDVCGGRCVDVEVDEANCGGCGDSCPTGATCTGGECTCPSGEEICGDVCVDLGADLEHCGACGNDCGVPNASSTCRNGTCVAGTCEDGYDDCDDDLSAGERGNGCEVNTSTSELHCGGCDVACRADEQCNEGDCSCMAPGGSGECSPSGCGCGSSEGCYYESSSTSWSCFLAGSVDEGGACTSADDCRANLSCVSDTCRAYCGQGQPCTGDCSPVYVDGEAVSGWNYCHAVCNPIPTSALSADPACPSGQRCTLLFAGSSVCSPVNPSVGTHGSRCESNADCQTGAFCNVTGHCTASCWVDDDTCPLFGVGLDCRTYVDPVSIDDNEVGECVPAQAAAGCKEPCETDADCRVTGTRCVSTTSGDICLNERCTECFDADLSCTSDNDTCAFVECVVTGA